MNEKKRKKLEDAGWKSGSVAEFLRLTPEESAVVEMRVALARLTRESRKKRGLSQSELATVMKSTQARVSLVESTDDSATLDLMLRSALNAGVSLRAIGEALIAADGVPESGTDIRKLG
jgi:ribosome-binding protein aMBF1 (putative translation factor)